MDPVLKEKWITALRSGEFRQGREVLKRDGTYCCLGVLAEIAAPELLADPKAGGRLYYPQLAELGVDRQAHEDLMELNDGAHGREDATRRSFWDIAAWIEKNL
jgi:hypothetical protein